jgi:ribonuclease BN (tRNA processing enzyme)
MMKVKILGCSGGVGGDLHTTSMLIDEDILVDAGTGVGRLSLNALQKINHVFITHAHMDHIAFLPLLLDSVLGLRDETINVYASAQVIHILKEHVFNWLIWPNFNLIPNRENPLLTYKILNVGDTVTLAGRMITALPVNHSVPAVGYQLDSGSQSLVFTGDTASCKALWDKVNTIQNLKYLIIETAFSNQDESLAAESKHLCPITLADELDYLHQQPHIYITHLKPGAGEKIMSEIAQHPKTAHCKVLLNEQVFEL